jgi:DNA repair exonuclease SbcCD nuclease subunit
MSKILLIGDLHIRKDNLDIMRKVCSEILYIIETKTPNLVIVLGDTEDRHENLFMPANTDAIKFFKAIAKQCELVVLIGNHDRENNSVFLTDVSPYVGLKEHPNITIVDTTIWDKEKNFIYVPYVSNGRFNEALSKVDYYPFKDGTVNLDTKHPRLVICHQEFIGCIMGVSTSSTGDVWSQHLPQIFSGHIHEYQTLPGVCYTGTPVQQNYGEGTDKALMMVYLEDSVNSSDQKNSLRCERIRLTSAPVRTTIHMTIADLPNFTNLIPPNCMVKVVMHIDAIDSAALKLNPLYLALKSSVDKVTEKIVSDRSSVAQTMVNSFKDKGSLDNTKKIFSINELVTAMLIEDQYALNIYQTEIAV